jgi:hypothetical protein
MIPVPAAVEKNIRNAAGKKRNQLRLNNTNNDYTKNS